MTEENTNQVEVFLKDVRINFPQIWQKSKFDKYGATFVWNEEDALVEKLKAAIAKVTQGEKLKGHKVKANDKCLRFGELSKCEGFEVTLNSGNNDQPYVFGPDGRTRIESRSDCRIYSGCRVNAKVRVWGQNNDYGKKVNCQLVAVQFARDDEPLTSTKVSEADAVEGFGEVESSEDDF